MKLFPPQDHVKIYEEGFGEHDLLGRKPAGERLSELLERVEDPIVVAVDGQWGSGKSHFLKRWVGAHTIENGGKANTVYFDAFANDYLDDPLIALTGAIGDRLPDEKDRGHWEKAKGVAFKLARPALRIAAAVTSAGATEIAGAVTGAAIQAGKLEAESAAEAFWRHEDGRKKAMQQFHASLAHLTETSEEGDDGKRLIIVVDELDRCRPDYALSVLEVIKHFFSVPMVHFVLGINMDALEHMVRVRYGAGINAGDYLKRFISISMHLPDFVSGREEIPAQIKYYQHVAALMGIDQKLSESVALQLKLAAVPSGISLRDIEKILTKLVLLPNRKEIGNFNYGWQTLIISLVLFHVMKPSLYRAAIFGTLTIDDVQNFYGIRPEMVDPELRQQGGHSHSAYLIREIWLFAISGGKEPGHDNEHFSRAFESFGFRDATNMVTEIEREFFGLFEVAE